MSPERATLLHSPGRKPWVFVIVYLLSPFRGGTTERINSDELAESAAPSELNLLLSVCTQGFISGFALIPPWAMQECRAYGTQN